MGCMVKYINLCGFILVYLLKLELAFEDVSSSVFHARDQEGILAAFGDFNADKRVDLFVITDEGHTIKILLSGESKPIFTHDNIKCTYKLGESQITSVVPGDFNGDTHLDVMITIESKIPSSDHITKVKILWGHSTSLECGKDETFSFKARGQPLAFDYDADMIVDFLGEDENGVRTVWKSRNDTFDAIVFTTKKNLGKMKIPHSNAFIDLNGDLHADLFITSENKFERWINKDGNYTFTKSIDPPPNVYSFHQVNFADLNANGEFEIIVPVCEDKHCSKSSIYLYDDNKSLWHGINIDLTYDNQKWQFPMPLTDSALLSSMTQQNLRIADVNMDGYPDLLIVLHSTDNNKIKSGVFLLMNEPCLSCSFGRRFQMKFVVHADAAYLAVFHDIFENGRLDMFIVSKTDKKSWSIAAYKNTLTYDAYFVKAVVLSGRCADKCSGTDTGFGTNNPGVCFRFNTITSDGNLKTGSGISLSKSAYFSLQLPYTLFGLGQTPNFLEALWVGLPQPKNQTSLVKSWKQIIPNSQVVIVPRPLLQPSRWIMKLFVTPSAVVLVTLGALVGLCGLITIIIFGLHWKEKREDRKEKQQDAHKFHFNAM